MKQSNIVQEPNTKVAILMWQVGKLLFKNKKQILEEFRLTCSQFEILSAIYFFSCQKREIIQIDLSEKTEIDPMTTSTILRNLQKKGLITRNRSLINTRTVIVGLTDKGMTLYSKAISKIRITNKTIYQGISNDHLISQLIIISDRLNKLNY